MELGRAVAERTAGIRRALGITRRKTGSLRGQLVALVVMCGLVALLPAADSSQYVLHVATLVLIYIPLSVGQTLVTGDSGQVAMGQAAYFGLGAYIAAVLSVDHGVSLIPIVCAGAAAGMCAGTLTGLPAIRISGDYLFIVTIGVNLMFVEVAINWAGVTGSVSGIPGVPTPSIGPVVFGPGPGIFALALMVAGVSVGVYTLVTHSWIGTRIHATVDDEIAVQSIGVNPAVGKVLAFTVASGLAALAGVVFAYFTQFVGPDEFSFTQSLLIFEMAILGGLGSGWGAALGAAILIALPQVFLPLYPISVGLGGAAIVVLMIVRPSGIMGRVKATTLIKK